MLIHIVLKSVKPTFKFADGLCEDLDALFKACLWENILCRGVLYSGKMFHFQFLKVLKYKVNS